MKKTIKSLLAIAVAAFAFTACSDVPEPYAFPSSTSDTTDPNMGKKDTPYDVASAIKVAGKNGVYVKGFIVGYALYTEGVGNTFTFGTEGAQASNFLIAATPDETNSAKCMPVALPTGDVRNALNLKDHPENLKKEINLYGDITKYFGQTGIKEVSYAILDGKDIGTDPGEGGTPSTAAIEVTCAEAVTATNKLADGATSTETYAVTGYITEVVGSVSRNQQTFWIADTKDGGKVFEAYYADLPDGVTEFKKGMKVKITGNLIKYVNSSTGAVTPEIKNAKVEILESGDEPGDTPAPGTPSGEGTELSPFNVAAAVAKCKEVGTTASTESYYIKGLAETDYTVNSYKNVEINIVDAEGATEKFIVYRVKDKEEKGIKEGYTIKKGDVIVVYGPVINYQNSKPETANGAYLVSVNGQAPELDDGQGGGGESGGGEGGGGGESGGGESTVGTYDNPYTIAGGIEAQGAEFKNIKNIYVKGYIVGWIEGQVLADGAHFNGEATVKTNILIADKADETDISKCMPVQLPNNAVRTGLNLQDNPSYYKKAVVLYGELAKYFGAAGVKTVTYAESEGNSFGTKP